MMKQSQVWELVGNANKCDDTIWGYMNEGKNNLDDWEIFSQI